MKIKPFKRVLVANRGEIAIRIFSACKELGIRCVAIYSEEDKTSLFRTRADESYQVGGETDPVGAYLNIGEIIDIAKKKGVDAIHPGYGFLAENAEFAKRCEQNGITFIGPSSQVINKLGDKIMSKIIAKKAGVPTIPGVEKPIHSDREAFEFAKFCGFPVMVKAAAGGGGRGMRIVDREEDLLPAFRSAQSEAKKAFGNGEMFIEKYLYKPKHIEVQILADKYGNTVHLYERDCSIQRRHQKVIEFTPAFSLSEEKRRQICDDAIRIAESVGYTNAGTVEFLIDANGDHYFIEVNPRIQVEHTVTELVTGIDIVQSQILIAQGYALDSPEISIQSQDDIRTHGYAIQCRVTTEDPANNFAPDTGRIDVYRSSSGFGVRLDGGNGFAGAVVSPYYDSLLVKISTHSRTFPDAIRKSIRSLKETTVNGVKTNIGFLLNVLNTREFLEGRCDTGFISEHPELFDITAKQDVELRILSYIGDKVVNKSYHGSTQFDVPEVPFVQKLDDLTGSRSIFLEQGAKGLIDWVKARPNILISDTTMRDAHQSLMATRMRTRDMVKIADALSVYGKDLFSLEMWGGATFDVAYRFLGESPWDRLRQLREKIPNILFQMLLRGNNAVGYKNYPDNVIKAFVKEASDAGIDVFRIFDSLNWIDGMRYAMEQVLEQGKIAEAAICYTGDILDSSRDKYSLDYYVKKAKELEKAGAQIIGIKDMSALLKPYAATKLIKALKNEVTVPIHLHTHDTTGNGVATTLTAVAAGVDIVDTAFDAMSGLTSQPALNSVVAALENTERETGINLHEAEIISRYWAAVRPVYAQFESDLKSGSTEIYRYEIPGGQYSNLKPQVESFGLGHRFQEVKEMYRKVNDMVGDIVKVTPSSKFVGDFAIFMVQNDLTPENILEKGAGLDYPDSVLAYFNGEMGQPEGGFPLDLQEMILKGRKPITKRSGEYLPDEDFDAIEKHLRETHGIEPTMQDIVSYALYPKVIDEYYTGLKKTGDLSNMGSDIFFHGLKEGEMSEIQFEEGKILVTRLIEIGRLNNEGMRTLTFEINGNRREVTIEDRSSGQTFSKKPTTLMADISNPLHIGANIPGTIVKLLVEVGDEIKEQQPLLIVEAMKMETTILAQCAGVIESIYVKEGELVEAEELLIELSDTK